MTDDLKAALLAGEAGVETTGKVETYAGTVTVRALTRSEVLHLNTGRELGEIDIAGFERKMVALAMVDPVMTEAEVKVMQDHPAGGVLGPITDKISELSGLSQGADKSRVPRVRGRR